LGSEWETAGKGLGNKWTGTKKTANGCQAQEMSERKEGIQFRVPGETISGRGEGGKNHWGGGKSQSGTRGGGAEVGELGTI